jgi:hypothetical protein
MQHKERFGDSLVDHGCQVAVEPTVPVRYNAPSGEPRNCSAMWGHATRRQVMPTLVVTESRSPSKMEFLAPMPLLHCSTID